MTTRIRCADGEVAALSSRYRAGVSIEGLSRHTGRDRRVLRRVLSEVGVRLRTRRPRPRPVEQTRCPGISVAHWPGPHLPGHRTGLIPPPRRSKK
ncbi:MAG: helix-turn-helix domain-containing protein [Pseudonocardiaceae bacterium]